MTIELAKERGGLAGFSGLPIDASLINRSDLLLAEQKPARVRERPRVLGSAQPQADHGRLRGQSEAKEPLVNGRTQVAP